LRRRAVSIAAASSSTPASVVGELAHPDADDEVSERDHGVEGLGQHDLVAEDAQEIVVALLSVLDGSLDWLAHTVALPVVADRLRGHSLVQPDHEHVHRDTDRDHTKTEGREIGEAEREHQRVGQHQESVAERLDLVIGQLDVFQRDLERKADEEEPGRADRDPGELGDAAERDDHDEGRRADRKHEEPHVRNAIEHHD